MFTIDQQRPRRVSRARNAVALCSLTLAATLAVAGCGGSSNNGANPPATKTADQTTSGQSSHASLETLLTALQKAPSGKVALTEDGSSLLYPLYQTWAKAFAQQHPGFSSTSGADGSGTGIADAESGTTVLGASDAYLPPGTSTQYPTLVNVPVAVSAQMINYNVPGLAHTHLKLSGKVVAEMYQGQITNWDDPAIKALNPGVSLPNLKIVPVHRSDSSGDSFLFTSYLAASDASSFAAKEGPSTAPTFPSVTGALAAQGNSGMVATCGQTKGCVAYIGVSYRANTNQAGLGMAALQNRAGNFELPSATTIHAEVEGYSHVPPSGTLSLIYGKADSGYPIVNFEYIVVKTNQSDSTVAQGLKAFLAWAMDPSGGGASKYLDTVGFQPLPSGALAVAANLLSKVS